MSETKPAEKKPKSDFHDSIDANKNGVTISNLCISTGTKRKRNQQITTETYNDLMKSSVIDLMEYAEKSEHCKNIATDIFAKNYRTIEFARLCNDTSPCE